MAKDTPDDKNPIESNPLEGRLFYSPVGLGQTNPLIGPAHVLLVDFMVTEKFLAKIIKDLHLKEIKFDEVAASLRNIQTTILELKGQLQKEDEASRSEFVSRANREINAELTHIDKVAEQFVGELKTAAGLASNEDNKLLIEGAMSSITNQMKALQKDVDKTFAKLEPKVTAHKPKLDLS